jgi:hypothetical protein
MLQQLATAVAVITGLFSAWAAVQALKRRTDPRFKRGDDVLAGCGTCAIGDACRPGEVPDACPDGKE